MEVTSHFVRVALPKYLKGLPVPNSVAGLFKLSGDQWLSLIPFAGTVSILVYIAIQAFWPQRRKPNPINLKIQKENHKVVNMVDIEDLGDKISYCRCWRSKKFPLCDGSHNKHNEETGDNVGPLVLRRKGAEN